jgi:hypothetical protein
LFRYPAAWKRRHGCLGTLDSRQLVVFTTGTYACDGMGERIGALHNDGVVVEWFWSFGRSLPAVKAPNARVGGQPARIGQPNVRRWICAEAKGVVKTLRMEVASPLHHLYFVTACMSGPNVTAGEREVRTMLSSVRFTR